MELQTKLDAIRKNLKIVQSCTWSDPGFRGGDRIAENDKNCDDGINITADDVEMFLEDEVFYNNNNSEWLDKAASDEENADENDKTILLQTVEVKPVKKGMKYRVKKIFRCCTPCIQPTVL